MFSSPSSLNHLTRTRNDLLFLQISVMLMAGELTCNWFLEGLGDLMMMMMNSDDDEQ